MFRRGVTLIELLVVILVMLLITAVTVPAITPALEGRKVREAARMVEVFLNGARNRAIGSGHAVGVLIEPDEFEPSQCVALSYVEQPDPYGGDYSTSRVNILGNGGFGAWQTPAQLVKNPVPGLPGIYVAGVSASDPVFVSGDVGWLQTVAPGDLMTLGTDDTTVYRIYLGEPYIDMNGNGQFDQGEPFNDVDGSGVSQNGQPLGTGYTPPDPSYIDPITGFFKKTLPPVSWGTQSAVLTYTFADPVEAIQYMSPTGLAYDKDDTNKYDLPIYLAPQFRSKVVYTSQYDSPIYSYGVIGLPKSICIDAANNGAVTTPLAFQFIRRPVKTSSATVNLPAGTCIDLGSNYVDHATNNIVGVPGSGIDMVVPFSGGSSTLGNYSTFRPNPLTDHEIIGLNSAATAANRPLMITFDPSGIVDMVYSYDERNFITNTSQAGQPINFTNYQGRLATSPIYLLVGRTELIDGDPEIIATLKNGAAPQKPIFNLQDPGSLWVSVNPKTGLISTTENVAPDLTVKPPTTQTSTSPLIQLYFNVQAYQGRSLARGASDMGGM